MNFFDWLQKGNERITNIKLAVVFSAVFLFLGIFSWLVWGGDVYTFITFSLVAGFVFFGTLWQKHKTAQMDKADEEET